MEEATRRFARRVLLVHLLLLVVVVLLVIAAAREIYHNTRQEVLQQAVQRQELLASQTAGAIEGYYQAILSDLEFARRAEEAALAAGGRTLEASLQLPDILWQEIESRADHAFIVDRKDLQISSPLPADALPRAQVVVQQAGDWLKTVREPAISPFIKLESGGTNLVAVPLFDRYALVAVVPVDFIAQRFLASMNRSQTMSATLLDNVGRTMTTDDTTLVGGNVFEQLHDRTIANLLAEYLRKPVMRTEVIENPLEVGPVTLPPRMVTAHPVDAGGVSWTILIASHLADVDKIINGVFRRAMIWAIFLMISMTAILVSTSIALIRGRSRLERLEHEMLTHEINQARQIQLAWLPPNHCDTPSMSLAALNKPANHISGDFYDWFGLPDGRMVVTIGDVTGHGMSAAFLMSTTQLLIRNTMLRVLDPGKCLDEVNRQLCTQVFSGQFVTMLICVLDPDSHTLSAAIAGHFPPLVGDGRGYYSLKIEPQLVMGIDADAPYRTERFDLPADADIVLYTDGVVEAANSGGDRFGIETLRAALGTQLAAPHQVVDRITDAVNEFRGGRELTDDLTIVAVRMKSQAAQWADPPHSQSADTVTG